MAWFLIESRETGWFLSKSHETAWFLSESHLQFLHSIELNDNNAILSTANIVD